MKHILRSIATVLLLTLLTGCSGSKGYDDMSELGSARNELRELDRTLDRADTYKNLHRQKIDSLAYILRRCSPDSLHQRVDLNLQISRLMAISASDSALFFADDAVMAAQTLSDSIKTECDIARLKAMTRSGLFNMAERLLQNISTRELSDDQRMSLWWSARSLYSYMQYFTLDSFEISEKFARLATEYDDSLMMMLPAASDEARFIRCQKLVEGRNYAKAKSELSNFIKDIGEDSKFYAMASYQMGMVNKQLGNEREYCTHMARAARSDIRNSVGEGLALFGLANWLYEQGDIEDAFRYSNFAMREANAANARMRAVNIASSLPMIDEAYRQQIDSSSRQLFAWLNVAVLLLIGAIVLAVIQIRQRAALTEAGRQLRITSQLQEQHLANFLALCSTYYHKLNSLTMLVRRKISSGQTEELLKLLKSGRYSDDEGEDIFEIFDRSFLEIYPDFVSQINSLLRHEEQFKDAGMQTLPVELRIYALVILGITESTRIAQILNYSVNTVYTYRNKMRNKAVDRENFEQQVADLGNKKKNFTS